MPDYSPKRRTAVVFAGSGTSGAYHAGVLKALEEAGAKIDLVVGSGVGTVAAVFAAGASGSKLHGAGGFWEQIGWSALYRLRRPVRFLLFMLGVAFGVFLLPVILALLMGILVPVFLVADLAAPGMLARIIDPWAVPSALRDPYIAALAMPVFILSASAVLAGLYALLRYRRRLPEQLESIIDASPATSRLKRALSEVAPGSVMALRPSSDAELGKRYVTILGENLGQPGFRELILRAADLDTGEVLPFVLLSEPHRTAYLQARARTSHAEGPAVMELQSGGDAMLFDAVMTGLLPPLAAPVRRVTFPRRGLYGGEVHRLTEATLAGGCGLADAMMAGAEQVILVTAVPAAPVSARRRRGLHALADATETLLERQAVEQELRAAERINRIVQTVGHRLETGERAWQDPATGRTYRDVALYVVRPERRSIGPLEWDGVLDPSTEVREEAADLVDLGYRDAYRLFIEPVLGAPEAPKRQESPHPEPVGL
jgi:patatin-like phospholipase